MRDKSNTIKINRKAISGTVGIIVLLLTLGIFSFPQKTSAETQYSFQHSEELKPLIHWNDYGPDAFNKAATENKPIFLLLTAPSWCYWCQVYESEDYLFNPQVVSFINQNFIPIYVDADRRQDLTRQYLEGGWPSTTILAPNGQRIYGYSGPRPPANMLDNMQRTVTYVANANFSSSSSNQYQKTPLVIPTDQDLASITSTYGQNARSAFDATYGGFGTGQKFPEALTLDFFLDQYEKTKDATWLSMVETTLENQYTKTSELTTNYRLFDPIDGGFHRYGTTRTWSPPHYEKMLYDNAQLLQLYTHLASLKTTPMVKEVVQKTVSFIQNNFYDTVNGGFYGNMDATPEERYYSQANRPVQKPRVEKTKYTDWNGIAIIAYLQISQRTGSNVYKAMAEKSLDFYAKNMITENGAYHYISPDGQKAIQGNLLDNAYLLLAFVRGYELTKNPLYLSTATKLADYSLNNLYDWYGGGFFERHSTDTTNYAPQELIILKKPAVENGVMASALEELHTATQNTAYLVAGVQTVGQMLGSDNFLDNGYYQVESAAYMQSHQLLAEYQNRKNDVDQLIQQRQKDSWLSALSESNTSKTPAPFQVSTVGINTSWNSFLFLLIVSFVAGLLSFLSPCCLPVIGAYIANAFSVEKRYQFPMAIAFFLGLSVVFTLLGITATFIGSYLRAHLVFYSEVAGIILIILGLLTIFGKGFGGMKLKVTKPKTVIRSFLFGNALALSWTPCVGPVLVGVLLLGSSSSSWQQGGLLLFVYSVGLAVPLLILSYIISRMGSGNKIIKFLEGKIFTLHVGNRSLYLHSTSIIAGLLFVIIGILSLTGSLYTLNRYIAASSMQKYIYSLEQKLIGK